MEQALSQRRTLRLANWRVIVLFGAPAAFFASLLSHPLITSLNDTEAVGRALVADTTRWGVSHTAIAAGSGLMLVAFVMLRDILAEAGDRKWSAAGLPLVILGGSLFAVLPGIEVGIMGAVTGAGADAQAAQVGADVWFMPVLILSSLLFLAGTAAFAAGVIRSRLLGPGGSQVVAWALVATAFLRFVPLGAALYAGGLAAVVAMWPLAYRVASRT